MLICVNITTIKRQNCWKVPGGPVVRTQSFHFRGPGSIPDRDRCCKSWSQLKTNKKKKTHIVPPLQRSLSPLLISDSYFSVFHLLILSFWKCYINEIIEYVTHSLLILAYFHSVLILLWSSQALSVSKAHFFPLLNNNPWCKCSNICFIHWGTFVLLSGLGYLLPDSVVWLWNFCRTSSNKLSKGTNKTLWAPGARRKEQWPHKRQAQTCLWVSRSLRGWRGSAVACCRVRGTKGDRACRGPFEGGCHYLHYLRHSLVPGQIIGREQSPTHQQKIGLKIYWACPLHQNKT